MADKTIITREHILEKIRSEGVIFLVVIIIIIIILLIIIVVVVT